MQNDLFPAVVRLQPHRVPTATRQPDDRWFFKEEKRFDEDYRWFFDNPNGINLNAEEFPISYEQFRHRQQNPSVD